MSPESEGSLRASLQPLIRDDLMKTWRDGMQTGLQMAHKMAAAIRTEAATRADDPDCPDEVRVGLQAQIAALGGLMSGISHAAEEVVKPEPYAGESS